LYGFRTYYLRRQRIATTLLCLFDAVPNTSQEFSSLFDVETDPARRNNVVRSGLKPILHKLGIPDENVGLHGFRHGLATELAESESITVLQAQMRHADVRTTLKVYAHVIPQSQRDSMERIARRSIGTNVPIGTGSIA